MNSKPSLQISGDTGKVDYKLLLEILSLFCETMGLGSNIMVSLVFCNSDEMQSTNRKFRGVDTTTDVLSFPADKIKGLFPSDEEGNIYLGEILIDINYILAQTNSNNLNKEIIPVLVHGLLHILGFDHLNQRQKMDMQALESKINILVGLDNNSEQ
jgi:probable rRNA maturation factor